MHIDMHILNLPDESNCADLDECISPVQSSRPTIKNRVLYLKDLVTWNNTSRIRVNSMN
jgi:hypothetical protein